VSILGAEILSGARAPGSRVLLAEELLSRFGASRVLMREVTKTLVAKGLISAKSRVGTHVLPPEYWNWFDPDVLAWRVRLGLDQAFFEHLAQMRRAVEPAAAALAALQRTDEHLREMRRALRGMADSVDDRHAFVLADLAFHVAVAAASQNPLFRAFSGVVEVALGAYFTLSTPIAIDAMRENVARHTKVANAIERGNPDAAHKAMINVIDEGVNRVVKKR